MQTDYYLKRPTVQLAVWTPILDLIDKLLLELGLHPSKASAFIVSAHTDKVTEPEASLYVMQMHLSGLYSVDTHGWGVRHSAYASPEWESGSLEESTTFCKGLAKEFLSTGISKCIQPALTAPEWTDYVFVPLQIPDDCVITDHSLVSVKEFVQQVGGWSAETQTRVLMKVHPGHRIRGPEAVLWANEAAKVSPYLRVTTGNIHSLLEHCKAVLVINSGVGFEALVHGKPVITIGKCDYAQATTYGNLTTLCSDLAYALRWIPDAGYLFAYHYLFSRCYWLARDPQACARLRAYLRTVIERS